MAENIDILTEKLENTKIEEAEFEKWNEFPPEIKSKCIKTMDFSTRWSLRSTSRTERALVDSEKLFLNELQILSNKPVVAAKCSSKSVILPYPYFGFTFTLTEKHLLLLKYIIEHCVIETLKIVGRDISDLEYEMLAEMNKPFSVKILYFLICENSTKIAFWIKRMSDRLERFVIDAIESMDDIMDIPIISNVHFFKSGILTTFENAHQLAQDWINNDAEIGREFQTSVSRAGGFALFSSKFQDRILSETPKFVRIRTENPTKHILLEQVLDLQSVNLFFGEADELLRMSVIPANMKEEEMDDEWISEYVIQPLEDSFDFEPDDWFS